LIPHLLLLLFLSPLRNGAEKNEDFSLWNRLKKEKRKERNENNSVVCFVSFSSRRMERFFFFFYWNDSGGDREKELFSSLFSAL
jgi:hypothetical protein